VPLPFAADRTERRLYQRETTKKPCAAVILVLLDRDELLSSRPSQGDEEMVFRASSMALLLACLPMAGCGTVANLVNQSPGAGGVIPFGGVQHDVACIEQAANSDSGLRLHPKSESEQYQQVAHMVFCAIDLPFSLVGDVVTWPYTASYTFINQPVPVPPVTPAPNPPPQTTTQGRSPTYPMDTLPQPRTLP
jgi:uncharacterized protein YceK